MARSKRRCSASPARCCSATAEARARASALAMENCPELLPALYGIWRAGLSAVPINSKLHAREMAWIMANFEAQAVPRHAQARRRAVGARLSARPCRPSSPPGPPTTRALLAARPRSRCPAIREDEGLAVLHQRHHRPAQGRDAQPPQPAVCLPLLLRRHRLASAPATPSCTRRR